MTNKPINQKVKVTFFTPTGKYKYSAVATVSHFIFEPEFKQDIVTVLSYVAEDEETEE